MKNHIKLAAVVLLCFVLVSCSGTNAGLNKLNNNEQNTADNIQSTAPAQDSGAAGTGPDRTTTAPVATATPATPKLTPKITQNTPGPATKSQPVPAGTVKPSAKPGPEPTQPMAQTVRVLIPEGFSVSQMATALEAKGVCKKDDFISTINSYDFSYYALVSQIVPDTNRYLKLEGYLFPDTYEFYKNMKPQDAIGKMLRNAESKIGQNYSYTGMTTYDIITLASIIEKEAASPAEMKKISSVFHNRLKINMRLQSDATIFYIEKYVKPNLTGNVDRYNLYYNTYRFCGLPAGPICSPGSAALDAAVHPDETDYFYFVSDSLGKYYYAETYEEHKANCILAGVDVEPSPGA